MVYSFSLKAVQIWWENRFCALKKHNLKSRFGTSKMHLSPHPIPSHPPVANVAVRFKTVALLLMIYCLMLLPLFVGVLCLVLVLLCYTISPTSFGIMLMGKGELVALL